jgi:hypothetical protein
MDEAFHSPVGMDWMQSEDEVRGRVEVAVEAHFPVTGENGDVERINSAAQPKKVTGRAAVRHRHTEKEVR